MRIRRLALFCVLAASLSTTSAALAQSPQESTKTLLTIIGSKPASASLVINHKFSLKGLDVTTKGTFAGYELKDKRGVLVAWGLRFPNLGATYVEAKAASFPAGTYRVTLVTDGVATVSIKALTAAAHRTVKPTTHADFTLATQTASSPVQGAARVPFTVPQRYALVVHIVGVQRGTDVAAYEKDCITSQQLCEASSDPGGISALPAGVGGSDGFTYQADYQPGDLEPGAANAIVEYAAASETASATSTIVVFS